MAIVVASSDMSEVLALSDRVVVLSAGVVSRVLARGDATEAAIAEAAFSAASEGLVTDPARVARESTHAAGGGAACPGEYVGLVAALVLLVAGVRRR